MISWTVLCETQKKNMSNIQAICFGRVSLIAEIDRTVWSKNANRINSKCRQRAALKSRCFAKQTQWTHHENTVLNIVYINAIKLPYTHQLQYAYWQQIVSCRTRSHVIFCMQFKLGRKAMFGCCCLIDFKTFWFEIAITWKRNHRT